MPHEGHIIIPMDLQLRLQAEWHEHDAAKQVWKRGERKRMRGRVKEIHNLPFLKGKGEKVRWSPLQAAVFAVLAAGVTAGFDVVRVFTPYDEHEPGSKSLAEVDFSVAQLTRLVEKDSIFYTAVMDGKIRLEEEAVNEMPRDWIVTADGTFAPQS